MSAPIYSVAYTAYYEALMATHCNDEEAFTASYEAAFTHAQYVGMCDPHNAALGAVKAAKDYYRPIYG